MVYCRSKLLLFVSICLGKVCVDLNISENVQKKTKNKTTKENSRRADEAREKKKSTAAIKSMFSVASLFSRYPRNNLNPAGDRMWANILLVLPLVYVFEGRRGGGCGETDLDLDFGEPLADLGDLGGLERFFWRGDCGRSAASQKSSKRKVGASSDSRKN